MNTRKITLAISLAAAIATAGAAPPAPAGAYATVAAEPNRSTATSLPDGRVYELVSPANNHGYQTGGPRSTFASADGNTVSYESEGPVGEIVSSGLPGVFVAQRSLAGWKSRQATPRGSERLTAEGFSAYAPEWLDFSSDFSHLAFDILEREVRGAPEESMANFYLAGPDPFVEPVWLARPVGEIKLANGCLYTCPISVLGGSPDLKTIYFNYSNERFMGGAAARGLYEYHDGVLSYAGVLPDGSVDPGGTKGLAIAGQEGRKYEYNPEATGNQVSRDGSRVFFSSPVEGIGANSPELYVHETEADGRQRTVLVSQSQLPGHVGEPAPHGVGSLAATPPEDRHRVSYRNRGSVGSLPGYASPDGSHVFFVSSDRLTSEAPETGGAYVFDVDTGVLEYVVAPGLAGIVTVAGDGSSFVFESTASSPVELDRWSAGPHGGSVSKIVQLPGELACGVSCVGPARLLDHNSVLVFSAEAPIAGFNDTGKFMMQIFRYDFVSNELSCLSCPPAGVVPSGTAELSPVAEATMRSAMVDRGVSADGSRVFFDSPDPLVPRAVNGWRNVYEWESGSLFLISSGTSSADSRFYDNSESGGDVFFGADDELVPGANVGGQAVYDARVPRPGDNPPPSSVACQGDVCQGPPSVPSLLGAPASAAFNGLGNVPPPVSASVVKTKAKAKAKKAKKRKRGRVKTGGRAQRANHGRHKR